MRLMIEILQGIEKQLNDNPTPFADVQTVYQFELTGDDKISFQLHFQDGKAKVVHDTETDPDCTLIMSSESFNKFLAGKLNGTMAYMSGKLRIKGDIGKALKLEKILKEYQLK